MKKTLLRLIPILLLGCTQPNNDVSNTDITAPTIEINGPTELQVGETGSYTYTATDNDILDDLSFYWDLYANNIVDSTSQIFSYTPTNTDVGNVLLELSGSDISGNIGKKTYSITVIPEETYSIEYIVYDAFGSDGAGLYSDTKTNVLGSYVSNLLTGVGLSYSGSSTLEINNSQDIDNDTKTDLEEVLFNYINMSSVDKNIVNPDVGGYDPFLGTFVDDQYTVMIKITKED